MKLLLLLATTFALLSCGTNSPQSTLKKPSYTTKTNASFNLPSCAGSLSEQAQRRTFAAPPRLKASDIHSTYWPLLTALGKKTNICFEIKHHQKHSDYLSSLQSQIIDYSVMCPFEQARREDTYKPLIRDEKKRIKGIIVANKDSGINKINDVQNQTFLAPFGTAFGGTLLTKAYLEANGLDLPFRYVRTHQNVYRAVANDEDFIGGGVLGTYQREHENLKSQLTIIAETQEFAAHPFSASKQLPKSEHQAIQEAWMELSQDKKYSSTLEKAKITRPVPSNYANDYAAIAELGLQKYIQ